MKDEKRVVIDQILKETKAAFLVLDEHGRKYYLPKKTLKEDGTVGEAHVIKAIQWTENKKSNGR